MCSQRVKEAQNDLRKAQEPAKKVAMLVAAFPKNPLRSDCVRCDGQHAAEASLKHAESTLEKTAELYRVSTHPCGVVS